MPIPSMFIKLSNMRKLAVVIGRFQVASLHEGHIELFKEMMSKSDTLLVMLGCITKPNVRNPLDYTMRRAMIKEIFPNAYTMALYDCFDDAGNYNNIKWSKEIDSLLISHLNEYSITLYSGRDGCKKAYKGILPFIELPINEDVSGTQLRKTSAPIKSSDFRAGVIYTLNNYIKY